MPAIQANPAPSLTDGASLRIISFNLRYTGEGDTSVAVRAPLLIAQLLEYNADSFGFQEATPEWMELLRNGLGEKYAYVGVGRDDGAGLGEFSPVFYLKDKFELLDSGTIWLSATPEKPSKYLSSACPRICTWAVLKNKADGLVFSHVNTHIDHISERARLKQIKVLLGKISELEKYGPVTCTGDFNVYEGTPVYKKMCQSMTDCKYASPITESCGTFHNYKEEGIEDASPIDYIFVKNGFKPLRYKVIRDKINNIYLSDHFGIFSDVKAE